MSDSNVLTLILMSAVVLLVILYAYISIRWLK